jgi:hypothetical protein
MVLNILPNEYRNHPVFSELETYMRFYDSVADMIFPIIQTGTSAISNLDAVIMLSMRGTMKSISLQLQEGLINDAYALVRKYHDSIIINAWEMAYLQNHQNMESMIVIKIDGWMKGKGRLPKYEAMMKYLNRVKSLERINALLYKNDYYDRIRMRCNDHMHYNFFHYMYLNDPDSYNPVKLKYLTNFSDAMRHLFIMHWAYTFTLNDYYMRSSDYIDALEVGSAPEVGSENWVSPYIQKTFDTVIKVYRKDIADEIKNSTSMQLE